MTSGPFRVDPHVKVLDERVVERAKARGLDGLVYAPHFTQLPDIERRAAAFSDDDLAVYPARELFTGPWQHRRHLLAMDLTDPVPDFLTLEGTLAELERQDATILVPHPTFFSVSLTAAEVRQYRDRLHALEVFNPKLWPHHHRRATALAAEVDLPVFASSYAHLRGTVGAAWTDVDTAVPDRDNLASALRDPGVDRTVGHRSGVLPLARRGLEFAHLGWENSWQKFVRVALSGREPTHPDDPIYEGRFDDVSVS